jgi:hypothetical protein
LVPKLHRHQNEQKIKPIQPNTSQLGSNSLPAVLQHLSTNFQVFRQFLTE